MASLNLKLNNGAQHTRFLDALSDIIKYSIHFSTEEVRGQQIYYCNVRNLASRQLSPFYYYFLNTEVGNFIFTMSAIFTGLTSLFLKIESGGLTSEK